MRISDWSSDVCSSDLLPGQDEPLLIAREEIELALEVVLPRGDVPVELVELDKAEGGPDLRRFQIVAEFLEQELGVIGNAVQLHVEACLDAFGDRTSVVSGKSVSVRVDLGGSRILKNKKNNRNK